MLARLRIGPKLLLAPGAVLLLLVLLSCAAYYAMVRQNQSLETIVGQRAANLRAATSLAAQSQKAHADIYRLLSWISGSFPAARTEPLRRDILFQHARVKEGLEALAETTAANSLERSHIEQAANAHRSYAQAVRDVIELAPIDPSIGANAMLKAESAFLVVTQRLADLALVEEAMSRRASQQARSEFRMTAALMPAVVVLAVALSLAITFAVRKLLLAEIRGIGAAASGLASGDLTVRERDYGGDEIADTSRALDASIRNLNATLRSILESARVIGAAARDIKLGNLSLGSRAVYRAGTLARTSSSMRELEDSLGGTLDGAQAANLLTASAVGAASEGGNVVERLVATLASGRRSAQQVVELADELDAMAGRSGTLALNAALDASRQRGQGDSQEPNGASMSAVALDVRELARKVGMAAREIRALASQSMAEIDGGTAWAAQAGSSMENIAGAVRQVEDIIGRIEAASAGQASNFAEVNQAIVRMDTVTRQNCSLVEEAAAAARSLQMQALALSRTMAAFRLDDGDAAPPQPAPTEMENGDAPRELPRERRRAHGSHLRLASSRK